MYRVAIQYRVTQTVGKPLIKMLSKHLLNPLPWRRYLCRHHPHVDWSKLVFQRTDVNRSRNSTLPVSCLLFPSGDELTCVEASPASCCLCRRVYLTRTINHVHLGDGDFDGVQPITYLIFRGCDARRAGVQLRQRQQALLSGESRVQQCGVSRVYSNLLRNERLQLLCLVHKTFVKFCQTLSAEFT